jgi:methylase of polypeptide subunit release factors
MIDREIQANHQIIAISQDLSLSHAGTVWDGALCQIAFLNKNYEVANEYLTNKNVLELGSGTGILGLAASLFKPKNIYLTDLPEYLDLIRLNKEKNKKLIPD